MVGVAEDHGRDAGSVRMQVQILPGVKHVEEFSVELDGFCCGQFGAGTAVVDVAANRCEWRDVPQRFEDLVISDIPGMQNVGATCERVDGF